MAKGDRDRGRKRPDDYRVTLGKHRFDPADTAAAAPPRSRGSKKSHQGASRHQGRAAAPAPDPADTRLVQFTQPLTGPDIDRIRSEYGLALTAYIPNLTYVEAVDAAIEDRLKNDFLVRAIAPYLPEYKLSAGIDDLDMPMPDGIGPGQVLLDAMIFDGGSTDSVAEAVEVAGGHDVRVIDDRGIGGSARVRFVVDDRGVVAGLAKIPDVSWIEPVGRAKADNVGAASVIQSGDAANASIWNKGLRGQGQIIGVMDDGLVDIDHCFLSDPQHPVGAGHRKIVSIRDINQYPLNRHATFVAALVAGNPANQLDSNIHRGGAWAARLALSYWKDVIGPVSMLDELNVAKGNGAFIHNNSWHKWNDYNEVARGVDLFTWTNEDHIVLGSSGNIVDSQPEGQGPPGTAKNAVSVSAAQGGANKMDLGDGSLPGPTPDGRRKPDLVAVGCGIESAIMQADVPAWMVPTTVFNCVTAPAPCATSWAAANASAAAALVRQYFIEGWYPTGEEVAANCLVPTGALLTAVLINSTVPMTGVGVNGYPSNEAGWGLIQLDRALYFAEGPRKLSVWDVRHKNGPKQNETRRHHFKVETPAQQLKVVLVWRDRAPAVGSFANPVVNDLDLRVITPDGATTYIGNAFLNGVSDPNPNNAPDGLNNIEVVVVDNPPVGKWTIEVEAYSVLGEPLLPGERKSKGQGYAIAATATEKSACFVAGAVYADVDHPDVETLRVWRDDYLAGTGIRRSIMGALNAAYSVVGPPAARVVEAHPRLKRFLRDHVFPRLAAAIRRRRSTR